MPLRQGPGYAAGCSAVVNDDSGVCGGASFDPETGPFMTPWPNEEAADGLMHGGLLWRESGFGRETELATEGVPQGIAEACRPVRELLLCRLVCGQVVLYNGQGPGWPGIVSRRFLSALYFLCRSVSTTDASEPATCAVPSWPPAFL